MELIILIWKDENKKGTFTQIIIQIKVCFYEKKKKKDLPIDYQTGSCHGEKKKKDDEHRGRVKKWWNSNYNEQNVKQII